MLDYYVATSLSAKASDAEDLLPFYTERVAIYKALDRQDGRRDWRPVLADVLKQWLTQFPESASKRSGTLSCETTNDRACSAVVIALRCGTQDPGFEPGLFHKACYMPLHGS